MVQPMVSDGVEAIMGIKTDPLFGPAVVFGLGGIFVELLRDFALRVPPIDRQKARAMIAQVKGNALLRGARGRPLCDIEALENAIMRVAALAYGYRRDLRALNINPLLVLPRGQGVLAVDWIVEFNQKHLEPFEVA